MTAPLTDAQVAALRELAERDHEFGHWHTLIKPLQLLALLAERDALKAHVTQLRKHILKFEEREGAVCPEDVGFEQVIARLQQQVDVLKPGGMFAWKHKCEQAEAALSALRARETGLREAMHAIYKGLSSEKDGEFWSAQKWCDDHDIYVDNLQGLRVLEEIARVVLSEGVK